MPEDTRRDTDWDRDEGRRPYRRYRDADERRYGAAKIVIPSESLEIFPVTGTSQEALAAEYEGNLLPGVLERAKDALRKAFGRA